jgi:hypothetical protein
VPHPVETADLRPPAKEGEHLARVWIAFGLLACLPGLSMRFVGLEWIDFGSDEMAILARAHRASSELSLHGIPSSIGIPLPNFLSYLLALPVTLTHDPVAIVRGIALLNLAGVAGLFLLLRRPFGTFGALCATAIFASAPWPVLLARKLWNPDFLFPFAMLLHLVLASQLAEPKRWKCAAAVVLYVVWCGFHASTWALALPLVLWAWWFRVPVDRRGLAIGVAIGLCLLAPWFAHFWTTGGDDFLIARAIRSSAIPSDTPSESFILQLAHHFSGAVEASSAGQLDALGPEDGWTTRIAALVARGWIVWGMLALAAALARTFVLAVRARRGAVLAPFDRWSALAGLVCATILLAYAATAMPAKTHFYAVLLPLPTVFAASFAIRVLGSRSHVRLAAFTTLVVAAHALLFARFLAEIRAGTVTTEPHYPASYARGAEALGAEIEAALWEVDHGDEVERAQQQALSHEFAAAGPVLLRYDGARDEPPAGRRGAVEIRATEAGLLVRGSVGANLVRLPRATPLPGRTLLCELELESPRETEGTLFYGTEQRPESGSGLAANFRVPRGASRVFVPLPADTNGALFLRVVTGRFVLRAAELRAAGPSR